MDRKSKIIILVVVVIALICVEYYAISAPFWRTNVSVNPVPVVASDEPILSEVIELGPVPEVPKPIATTSSTHPKPVQCVAGGCSGQVCQSADVEPRITTCEYREEYSCYKSSSTCERQQNGQCGWTQGPALTQCLQDKTTTSQEIF